MMKDNDLQVVLQFLGQLEPEVSGRSSTPPPEMEERLARLAVGGSSDEDKQAVCEMVRGQPGWIQWMAERVKERRTVPPLRGQT